MRLPILSALLLSALFASAAVAQGRTDYTLNEGQVHFRVPAGWNAVMEKTEGDPQAVAFQVPDETAQGSEDSATVVVKTRRLKAPAAFAAFVQDEHARAESQGGYAKDASNRNDSLHQYFVVRGKTRYLVRDSYFLSGETAVEVRCQRPLLDATPAAWNAQFDSACDGVTTSLKK